MKTIFLTLAFCSMAIGADASDVKFPQKKIMVGSKKLTVELAVTNAQRQRGLMHRKTLAADTGMLFKFGREQVLTFWMKNTYVPLSIGFFTKDKVLVDIQEMEPVTSMLQFKIPRYHSKKLAMYALEVNRGWFKKNKISLGKKLVILD